MAKNINTISPSIRDVMLNMNIGKYNMVEQLMINPIGKMSKLYEDLKTKSEMPDGLFEYYNNILKINHTGELEQNVNIPSLVNRNTKPVIFDYPTSDISKYSYIENKQYQEYKNNDWLSLSENSIFGILNKDSIAIDLTNDKNISSNNLENNTSLLYRIGEYSNDTDLGKIGLKQLGLTLANSTLQKTLTEPNWFNFLTKTSATLEAIDQFDFDKFKGLNIPGITINISNSILPIYMYSEIKKVNIKDFSWLNEGQYVTKDSFGYVYDDNIGKDKMINEDGQVLTINDKSISNKSLLYKTQKLFENGKIKTLISKTSSLDPETNETISKGRNLLGKNNSSQIRTWTTSNQYNKLSSLLRPFNNNDRDTLKTNLERIRPNSESTSSLETYGVLQKDGFVKIAPYKTDKFGKTDVKKYMFSIENLAWKDSIDSFIENTSQEGPNGGRIMWFPPYDITFNETTSVNWNSDVFIGRGEPVYTYSNTERNGTLNFKLIVDHPSVINFYKEDGYGSDGKKIEEDDYLRFFSGQDIIKLKKQEEKISEEKIKQEIKPVNQVKTVKLKIYFPNNYSGINDGYSDAIKYLYSGTGCTLDNGNGYENVSGLSDGMSEPCNGKYYYRVDTEQNLKGDQYKDLGCYGLNNSKQEGSDFYSFREFYEQIEITNVINNNYDVYDDNNNFILTNKNKFSKNKPKEKEYSELFKILKEAKQITLMGSASKQGIASGNVKLAENRMKIVENWLTEYNDSAKYTKTNIYKEQGEITSLIDKNTNSKTNKQDRFVYIEITNSGENVDVSNIAKNIGYNASGSTNNQQIPKSAAVRLNKKSMYGYYFDKNNPNDESLKLKNDESNFFEQISNTNDQDKKIIFNKLSEKIKYFMPAFHSTTPEGFNSRLTFLHQCTRQGPTLESKNGATNMAFGRPPICILRIGDFYNTKVVFESLNIDFDPLVWDLNEEGIGVQPMIATVSMNFKFIGGSDLTGPIARLQNAITYNFFANTGVYDDRNDRITRHEYTTSTGNNNKTKTDYTDTYETLYNPGIYDKK